MHDDLMKHALKNRRGKGLDITIVLGKDDDSKDGHDLESKSGLAPKGNEVIDADNPDGSPATAVSPTGPQGPRGPQGPHVPGGDNSDSGDGTQDIYDSMMDGMNDNDKGKIANNPRSLREVALNHHMKKMGKGK